MPVRFQVDSDFYDHPKTIDMSDAATALWTRAGSYSAAKLTDGFIKDAILPRLSQTPEAAAKELVRRGLWKRVRGGYRFHQWEDRGNLTRERIEAERSADRQRKRRARQTARGNENDQVGHGSVRSDVHPDSDRNPDGIRGLSVSVSESVSNPPNPQGGNRGSRRGEDDDPDFIQFWETYPIKKDKGHARKAWRTARKRGVAADVIIKAAQRYRDNPQRKPDYTAYPATWLNGERYNDFDDVTSPASSGGWWDN